jgi:glycosyltransferase involved in cell wall biosynthesis
MILLHDVFAIRGGGERLALTLASGRADALCYGYRRPESFDPEAWFKGRILDLEADGGGFGLRTLKLMLAFRYGTGFVSEYDVAVHSGMFCPLALYNRLGKRNISYCNTPPRFAYDKREEALAALPAWKRPFMRVYARALRMAYSAAMARMDLIVSNSENIRARVKRYLGRDSLVVHPPVDVQDFTWRGQGDYYLSTARHDPLKRVDVVVRAFARMPDKRLIVASGGSETERLKRLAQGAGNIAFTGWTGEEEQRELIGKAIATVYIAHDEDFGISPVESMAAGKPVLGVAEGGLLETMQDGKTGVLLAPDPKPEQVMAGVRTLSAEKALAMRGACETRAKDFGTRVFLEKMGEILRG